MNKTKIETADFTWNPITGCDNICFEGDCYAYELVKRFGKIWGYGWAPSFHPERLFEPNKILEPRLIFAPSMGDLFCKSFVENGITKRILQEMGSYYWHRFEVQTKFAEQLPKFKYPDNVWLGVSLCYSKDVYRLDYLRKTNARIKYAYCEPLLEKIEPDLNNIDWVVIGAKTGSHKFQPPFEWIQKLTLKIGETGAKCYHKNNLWFVKCGGPPPPIKQFPDYGWCGYNDLIKRKLALEVGG